MTWTTRVALTRERGAAAVEFALVAMMLITILFGIIEFGRFWMIQSTLSQIAREGVREMAINGDEATGKTKAEGDMATRVSGLGLDEMPTIEASTVGGGLCEPGKVAIATIELDNLPTMTGITFWGAISLTGEAEMRCGG